MDRNEASGALMALFERSRHGECHEKMLAYASRRVGRGDGEELVQEAWLRAYRRADAFRGESHAQTWVFGILRNLVLEHHRRARRSRSALEERREDLQRGLGIDVAVSEGGLLGALSARWELDRLPAEVRALPPREREAFVLVELRGASREDACAELGISDGTLRVRICRARKRLRARLAPADARR
ncbi:MAG: RNA polymerase sigma factor [Myxococcota bacterium]